MSDKSTLRLRLKALEADFLAKGEPAFESNRILSIVEDLAIFKQAKTVLAYMSIAGEVQTDDFVKSWYESGKRVVLPVVCGSGLELREYDPSLLVSGYRGILEPSKDSRLVLPSEIDLALVPGVAFARLATGVGGGAGGGDGAGGGVGAVGAVGAGAGVDAGLGLGTGADGSAGISIGAGVGLGLGAAGSDASASGACLGLGTVADVGVGDGAGCDVAFDAGLGLDAGADDFRRNIAFGRISNSESSKLTGYYRLGRGGGYYDRLLPLLSCPKIGVCFPFRVLENLPVDTWDAKVDAVIY